MKPRNCLIFGASGQIGRNLIRKLTQKNLKVTAVTRNLHQKGYILKTQANPGYLDIVEANLFNQAKIEELEPFSNRKESDLRGHLENSEDTNKNLEEIKNKDNKVKVEEKKFDYQLNRALDLLEGISLYNKINA